MCLLLFCCGAATIVDAVIQANKLQLCLSGRVFRASHKVCAGQNHEQGIRLWYQAINVPGNLACA
eukprot:16017581-Heterocapsa_arctica.AAC.1